MKKFYFLLLAALMMGGVQQANAQFFKNLVDKAADAAKKGVENRVTHTVEDAVDKALDPNTYKSEESESEEAPKEEAAPQPSQKAGWTCPECGHQGNTGKFCGECGAKQPGAQAAAGWTCPECGKTGNTGKFCDECGAKQPGGNQAAAAPQKPKSATAGWNRYDFVAGDEIIFEDNMAGERVGEIPSKWNLLNGDFEVATMDGEEVLCLFDAVIEPLMKQANYLTDKFTLEFDYYELIRDGWSSFSLNMYEPEREDHSYFWNQQFTFNFYVGLDENSYEKENGQYRRVYDVRYFKTNQQDYTSTATTVPNYNGWNHVALSYNNGAVKVYVNQDRVVNGNMAQPYGFFTFQAGGNRENPVFVKNVRLAKGAVPLYDRLATDGKIITYSITFETGKATLKPESMGEINRIAKLMQENPNLSFEVQGHCDATGSDKVNDPLSQKRAEAIVAALVDKGIAAARLTAVGKGSHSPIASNSTDEGRAKNRRVEFVKK